MDLCAMEMGMTGLDSTNQSFMKVKLTRSAKPSDAFLAVRRVSATYIGT